MSTTRPASDEVAAALARVSKVDLEPIKAKLRHEDPDFWTDEVLAETEIDYRRFLALSLLHPDTTLSVNKALDEFWHQHILDTRKYAADCEAVFGYFLHHYPYFGIEGEEEWQENVEKFELTQAMWEQAFGVGLLDKPRLTLDKPLGTYEEPDHLSSRRIYAFPQACKSGQHCNKIIGPERIRPDVEPIRNPAVDPKIMPFPREPFRPPPTRPLGR